MDAQKNIFQLFGDWLAARQARRCESTTQPHPPRRLTGWLPTRGNVIFTLAMIALLIAAQTAGALPLARPQAAPAAASTGTIAYQGRLADAAGKPLTGTYNMIFRLYDAATGGSPLWSEPWTGSNGVKVSDGLFNVMLGSLAQLPISQLTNSPSLFLGITVGTDDEMQPRVQLGSVPFAVQALTVPDGSVTTGKIADGAVTQAKLGADVSLAPPDGSVTTAKIADGAVIGTKVTYEGFSYFTNGYDKPEGWLPIVVNSLDFNTFGANTFDTVTGTFVAPKAGYYRFRTHGFIATGSATGERVGVGIYVNGSLRAFSGGQFSVFDTPGPQFSHVTYLQAGDTVRLYSYTPIAARFGGGGNHYWWFQGEYVGR